MGMWAVGRSSHEKHRTGVQSHHGTLFAQDPHTKHKTWGPFGTVCAHTRGTKNRIMNSIRTQADDRETKLLPVNEDHRALETGKKRVVGSPIEEQTKLVKTKNTP